MLIRFIYVIFSICFLSTHLIAQKNIDSLLKAASFATVDSTKAKIYVDITQYYIYNDVNKLKVYADTLLPIYVRMKHHQGEAYVYNVYGIYYAYHNDLYHQKFYLAKSDSLYYSIGDSLSYYSLKNEHIKFYKRLGDYERAYVLGLEVLSYFQRENDRLNEAKAYSSLAQIMIDLKRYESAQFYLLESIAIRRFIGDKRGLSISLLNLGATLLDLNKPEEAAVCLEESLELQNEFGNKSLIATTELNLSKVYMSRTNYKKSLSLAQKAANYYESVHDSANIVMSQLYIAESYMEMKDFRSALSTLEMIKMPNQNSSLHTVLYELYAKIYEQKGDFKKAFYYVEQARENDRKENEIAIQNRISELKQIYESNKIDLENTTLKAEREIQELHIQQQTYWIVTLAIISLMLLVIMILWLRSMRARSVYALEKMQQRVLRAQMNPHFMFNSLMAIQNYIYQSNVKEAGKYLASFARLMRGVLDNSLEEYIPISKELKWLEEYVGLQMLRFEHPIQFSIHIDSDIQIESTLIPPMLVQPFIENAFEHGLKKKQEGGWLNLSYCAKDDLLIITVEDNGLGIVKSESKYETTHQSVALKLTKQRLQIINKGSKKKVFFDIKSVENKGTIVTFTIPKRIID